LIPQPTGVGRVQIEEAIARIRSAGDLLIIYAASGLAFRLLLPCLTLRLLKHNCRRNSSLAQDNAESFSA
jgi:hypothetical protein